MYKGGVRLKKSLIWSIVIGVLLLISILLIGFWLMNKNMSPNEHRNMDMGAEDKVVTLKEEPDEAPRPLKIPDILEPSTVNDERVVYDIEAKTGESVIKTGEKTKTLGYNGNYLGPVIRLEKGQKVTFRTKNSLNEETSFHWHGLVVPAVSDGGPHQTIPEDSKKEVSFTVKQDAATLWFHPHPEGNTAKQVYQGLAGLIYIDDENQKSKNLPSAYGKNDFPVIIQDRNFTEDNQFDYANDRNSDGTQGESLVINGTIRPYLDVKYDKIRLRMVNGSNAREYNLALSNGAKITQIATDGGLLLKPVSLTNLKLSPGERAEIILDFTKVRNKKVALQDGRATVLRFNVADSLIRTENPQQVLNQIDSPMETEDAKVDKITLSGMGHMVAIDGQKFDMNRIDKEVKQGTEVIWEVTNEGGMMGDMNHPFHIHGTQFQIVSRNGRATMGNERGLKDTVVIAPNESVKLKIRFNQKGVFMYHCHNLEHEENGMMAQVKVL